VTKWGERVKSGFVWFLGLCLFLEPAFAEGQQIDVNTPTAPAELPFKVHHGFLIVVEGQIGTLSKLKFILDTGTTRTLMDKRVARRLGIRGLPTALLAIRQNAEVQSAIFSHVRFGPMQATNIPLLIADLSSFTEYADGIDGILGLDLLWDRRISIDFVSKKLSVSSVAMDDVQSFHQGKVFCPIVTAEIQGHLVRLLVDTGMDGILLYHDRVPRLDTGNLKVAKVGHSLFVNRVMVQKIRVGTADLQHPKVLLFPTAPVGFPRNVDGMLGAGSLNARGLLLDFSQGTLTWQ